MQNIIKQLKSKKGFSLIELLVVISIIGILITVSVVSYNNVRRNARDGRRRADLENVRQTLVMFRSDNGCYPNDTYNAMMTYLQAQDYWSGEIPTDPRTGADYSYTTADDTPYCVLPMGVGRASFTLTTTLERGGSYSVTSP